MNFVGKGKIAEEDTFIKTLDEKVKEAKHNIVWKDEYMFLITKEGEKFSEGREEKITKTNESVAADMLKKSLQLQLIEKISQLPEDVIRGIASNLGLAIAV